MTKALPLALLLGLALKDSRPVPWSPPAEVRDAVERLNAHRRSAGVGDVVVDEDLSRACGKHARYLVRNDSDASTQGLGAHCEKKHLPGWSEEGELAGERSLIAWEAPARAVDDFMASFHHRIPLLSPSLARIGIGHATGGQFRHVVVVDVTAGVEAHPRLESSPPVLFPPRDAAGIRMTFAPELPSPLAYHSAPAGNAITVTWFVKTKVTAVGASLFAGDDEVAFWLSSPEKPACPEDFPDNRGSICIIPRLPLKRHSAYRVSVTCRVNGEPWSSTWHFRTAE